MTYEFRKPRRAFTLVEILVVIAIIAILAALASYAVFAMVGNQQSRNTNATIKVVNKVLQSHWQFVVKQASDDVYISPAVIALAQPDPNGDRAKVLWVKFRLMEAFPQSYADVTSPFVYNFPTAANPYIPATDATGNPIRRYIAAYQKNLVAPPFVAANTYNGAGPVPGTQSAACLLMALAVNRGGNALSQDQIGYAVADTDNDGVKELVDAWSPRSPLVPFWFKRFDTTQSFNTGQGLQLVNPAANVAGAKNAKFADALDPEGTLLNPAWYGTAAVPTASRTIFETNVHVIETSAGSGNANYVIPSIASAGKDGVFGTPDDIISTLLR